MKIRYTLVVLFLFILPVRSVPAANVLTYDWRTSCVSKLQFHLYAVKLTPVAYIEKGVADPLSANEKTREAYKRVDEILEFYRSVFNWDSINNAGATIHLHTNLWNKAKRGCDGVNAFYTPINNDNHVIAILLGHRDTNLHMAMDADVIGHEFTHGVFGTTQSNSFRSLELDALNESVSDMMGVTFKGWLWANKDMNRLTVPKELYQIGKNTGRIAAYYGATFPGGVMRNMANPSQQGDPDHVSGVVPNHEIHSWGGVTNLAFYLLAEGGRHPTGKTQFYVKGIGLKKASHLVFYTLKHRLRFTDMRSFAGAVKKAARKVYGNNSAEMISTHNAFAAVGLFDSAMEAPPPAAKPEAKPKQKPVEKPKPKPEAKTTKAPKPAPPVIEQPPTQTAPAPEGNIPATPRFTLSGTTVVIIFVSMIAFLILMMLWLSRSKGRTGKKKNRSEDQIVKAQPGRKTKAIIDVSSLPTDVINPNAGHSPNEVACRLTVMGEIFSLSLDAEPLCLGRTSADLPNKLINLIGTDETLSRQHCNVWYQAAADQFCIECLSSNGMSVNSVMLHQNERHSISFNKEIQLRLGSTLLTFSRV